MIKLISAGVVALMVSSVVVPVFDAPAFAAEEKLHHHAKGGGGGLHGGGGGLGGGNKGAGVAAGVLGLAIGAIVIDALAHANSPAPRAGCHYENQPLFDAYGHQVSSHRVRVCD
jgi:hypothetical protein